MNFKTFNYYLRSVSTSADLLQKRDLINRVTTKSRFTQIQIWGFILSVVLLFFFPQGFTDNFAGFVISFLGIFIGLFTSVVITMHDKSKALFSDLDEISSIERARLTKLRNFHLQFTGLTGYSILLGLVLVLLLILVLLSDSFKTNIFDYHLITSWSKISFKTTTDFFFVTFLVIHRLFTIYLFTRFFSISIYSISSYFAYLIDDYKRIKVSSPHEV